MNETTEKRINKRFGTQNVKSIEFDGKTEHGDDTYIVHLTNLQSKIVYDLKDGLFVL